MTRRARVWSVLGLGAVLGATFGICRERAMPRITRIHGSGQADSRSISVPAGADFQRALEAARGGDIVTLEAGAVFQGPFSLPNKPGDGWITIRSSAEESLPPAGTRVDPSEKALMPTLESATEPVIKAAPGAHHYRFVGIEIRPRADAFLKNLVELGGGETRLEALPHDLDFERCYIHGDKRRGARRGIALNSKDTTIVDSYLSEFKEVGADSQAIAGWNGAGPFRIENNTLEAAGENLLFGGADPTIPNLVPSDISVLRNHFTKPLSWKAGESVYEGTPWTVKNLLELKNARRVRIEGNLLERNWAAAQNGFAILFTVRNQDGGAPWSVVEDVSFVSNRVRDVAGGVNILGHDDNHPSGQTRHVVIRNNLFENVGNERFGGGGRLFQLLDGTADVVIEHNTAFPSGNLITAEGRPHSGFAFRDNIVPEAGYGVIGDGAAPGRSTLDAFFPGASFQKNVIVGGDASSHPKDNFFPTSLEKVGFVDLQAGDYRLRGVSPYSRAATDGRDIGVDVDALTAAMGPALSRARADRDGSQAVAVASRSLSRLRRLPPRPRARSESPVVGPDRPCRNDAGASSCS
jgi:hypothetical protein